MTVFADYASLDDGIAARVAFIRENKRYTRGGYYSASTPEQAAVALQRSGYATDPNYARSLIGLMRGAGIDTTNPVVRRHLPLVVVRLVKGVVLTVLLVVLLLALLCFIVPVHPLEQLLCSLIIHLVVVAYSVLYRK